MTHTTALDLPLVSVILPVWNRAGSIARAIRSVLEQTYAPLELIVIDDGSDADTVGIVEGFGNRVQLIRQASAGAYVARNAGLEQARGTLIAFADSDDAWHPEKLAAQVPLFADPGVGLVYGDVLLVDATGMSLQRTSFQRSRAVRGDVLAALADANFVPTSTVVVRRACLTEIEGFDVTQRVSADYLAWFRIAERRSFDYVPHAVADYTVHPGGISADLGRSLTARIALFSRYRHAHAEGRVRSILALLLAQLSFSLMIAVVRGKADTVDRPLSLVFGTLATISPITTCRAAIRFIGKRISA